MVKVPEYWKKLFSEKFYTIYNDETVKFIEKDNKLEEAVNSTKKKKIFIYK